MGVWGIGVLAVGETATLTITVIGTAAGTVTNGAWVSALNESDPNLSNDSASASVTLIQTYTLTIVAGQGGTTSPQPGTYNFDVGTSVSVQAIPAEVYEFDSWSGDGSGSANPVTVLMNGNKAIQANFTRAVKPPLSLTGEKLTNRNVSMVEYVVRLRWQPNPANTGTITYRIYQIENGQATAIANVGTGTYEYIVRRLQATRSYRFGVTAVNSQGWESDMVEVAVQ
jgi:hypothetical protein